MVEIEPAPFCRNPSKATMTTNSFMAMILSSDNCNKLASLPKKHVLNNKISANVKDHIWDTYHFAIELVPPKCH